MVAPPRFGPSVRLGPPLQGRDSGARSSTIATSAAPPPGHVLVGEFGRAHGLAGEIRLKSYTGDPLAIARYGPLAGPGGRSFTLNGVRQAAGDQPDLLVARVAGVATREAAEALSRVPLHVARERIPPPEDEDEFLLADLVGLDAVDPEGRPVGRITAVPNYGGGDLLEIMPPGLRQSVLVPFTRAFVPEIDVAARRIVVDLPVEDDQDAEPSGDGP